MPSPKQKGSKGKGKGGKEPAPPGAKSSSPARAKPKAKKEKKKKPAEIVEEEPIDDGADIVVRVARMMKSNKLSQVQVGQEARVSQAVISQWLARKYHGHNDKVDKAMEDWLEARRNGTLNSLVAPLTKEGTTSVLRPSHHKAPVKRKSAGQVSKTQIQAQIQEAATGLTLKGDEDTTGKRKRKRPPQLTEALGADGPRSSRRRGDGRIFSPSEFAPINALGQLETPVDMPTPGNTPWGEAPGPFWETAQRGPTPRDSQGAVNRPSVRGAMSAMGDPSSMRGNRPLIDVDSLLPPSPAAGARRSPRIAQPATDPGSIPAGTMPLPSPSSSSSSSSAAAAASGAAAASNPNPSPKGTRSSPRVSAKADKQFALLSKMLG